MGDPRICEACGQRPPATERARFCADAGCRRARARTWKRRERGQIIEFPAAPDDGPGSSVHAATLATLASAGREDTPLGRAALVLASRLDHGTGDTGSSTAALARELRATLEEAMRGVPQVADAVDDLRARVVRLRGA
jgi:hypothetical protein